jgi:hypothetical protein
MQAKFSIRYASELRSLLSALFYIEAGSDLYCWHAQLCDHNLDVAFYVIENFYTDEPFVLHRSLEDDVHGPWITLGLNDRQAVRCPVPEAFCHELERMQSRFVEEWLFFRGDPDALAACQAYEAQNLPVHAVNINLKKLTRMASPDLLWEHHSAGFDENVLELLQKYGALSVGEGQELPPADEEE